MRILLVEDDPVISVNLTILLKRATFAVDQASTLTQALHKSQDDQYDLFLVDWMLPDGLGTDLITHLRKDHITAPILMLTAKNQLEDIVEGLDTGADDYLAKPFDSQILLARIRALLRRPPHIPLAPKLVVSDLTIDTNTHVVVRQGKTIDLSPKEFALLDYLARNRGKAIDRLTLLEHVWDDQTDSLSNTVDVHIRYLRKKIDDRHPKKLILTVKGKGYMLCAD